MRVRTVSRIALICAATLAVAGGCSNSLPVLDSSEGGLFSKKVDLFAKPDWAVTSNTNITLGPQGPVGPNDLVGPDGRCAVEAQAQAAPAAPATPEPPSDRAVGSMAGDLAGAPMPQATPVSTNPTDSLQGAADPGAPQVIGGIALGMTECQAVRRAGLPGNVAVSAGQKGERRVVLTYLTGVWPGIYHFSDGRLKEIKRAPAPPESAKPVKKQKAKKPVKPKQATSQTFQRTNVQ